MSFHAVIPAGGVGSRLWPLSTPEHPKFLIDLLGRGSTLLQDTVARLKRSTSNIYVMTGERYVDAVHVQCPDVHVYEEPYARGTMPAIALAAFAALEKDSEAIIGSFASDHFIERDDVFDAVVADAVACARHDYLVTIGIEASLPSTAYGYIEYGDEVKVEGVSKVYTVASFKEKPSAQVAQEYLNQGNYFWNAGIFIVKAKKLLDDLRNFDRATYEGVKSYFFAQSADEKKQASDAWKSMEETVIDITLAEPLASKDQLCVVPASMGWSDIGDYASLHDISSCSIHSSNGSVPKKVIDINSSNTLVYTQTKPVVLVGVNNLSVVETDEAFVVISHEHAQEVKKVAHHLPLEKENHA
ncbi:MAG: NTP transferase domain-containing protein [Actinomycetaceae bacterium]|nr:NTP transferase domain-containing protein [Actinomycetaceae bacterium]